MMEKSLTEMSCLKSPGEAVKRVSQGNYNPNWAIAFQGGKLKHTYFITETKGSMSSMELRKIEESKIECDCNFLSEITSDHVE